MKIDTYRTPIGIMSPYGIPMIPYFEYFDTYFTVASFGISYINKHAKILMENLGEW